MNETNITDFFNNLASSWDEKEEHTQEYFREFLSFIPFHKNDKVLDVACGTGVISEVIYDYTKTKVDAIDISEKMILVAKAKHNLNHINFMCKSFYEIEEEYDKVIVFNAFPHFMDLDMFLTAAIKTVKKDGYLIICHNLSRKALDKHHEGVPSTISRSLEPIEIEAKRFLNNFTVEKLVDSDAIILLLKKK